MYITNLERLKKVKIIMMTYFHCPINEGYPIVSVDVHFIFLSILL